MLEKIHLTNRLLAAMAAWMIGCTAADGQPFLNLETGIVLEPANAINTRHLEYAPMYYGTGLVFVHARDQDRWIDRKLGMPFFELMYAELGPDGLPGKAVSFSPNIRTRFHEGPASFTTDLQQVMFTRTNALDGQDVVGANRKINLKIYLADKGMEDWVNIRELTFCSDDHSVQSPALSPDNQQIIFMSDMPGGFGGWDLYYSRMQQGTWTTPVNLGPVVNTAKDERSPFWHEKGVLFFASDGHPGAGDLDLFAALIQDDHTYSVPVNLGPKFNSRRDDLSLIVDAEGKTGFFASSRKKGLGKDDIYRFSSDTSIFSVWLLEKPLLVRMHLALRDAATGQPASAVSVWVFPIGQDGPEGLSELFTKTIDGDGQSRYHRILDADRFARTSDVKGIVPLELDRSRDHLILLQGQQYEQMTTTLRNAAIGEGNGYIIDIVAMAPREDPAPVPDEDCITSSALVLANSTNSPLRGVQANVRNNCTGSVQIIETNHRGEFRTCLIPGCDYRIILSAEGYVTQEYAHRPGSDPGDRTFFLDEADLETRTGRAPEAGDVLILDHIYYDFNKSAIRTAETGELLALARMMKKYPGMTIELESHTDARGDADYNLALSERRALSVQEFLVSHGISLDRITLKPMGESRLRNHCSDGVICTAAEHQENRRTEIHILTVSPDLEIRYPDQDD